MKLIGRKLYLAWGDDTVIAIEKLSMNPEELGMKKSSDMKLKEQTPEDYIRLMDVVEVFGETQVVNPRTPLRPSPCGVTIDHFFMDRGNWIDEKDAEMLEKMEKSW